MYIDYKVQSIYECWKAYNKGIIHKLTHKNYVVMQIDYAVSNKWNNTKLHDVNNIGWVFNEWLG